MLWTEVQLLVLGMISDAVASGKGTMAGGVIIAAPEAFAQAVTLRSTEFVN